MLPTEKIKIEINTIEATFLYRALLQYQNKIVEILGSEYPLTPELEKSMKYMLNVATYQQQTVASIMDMLTEKFETNTNLLLPQ